jgi:hypothetical protein
VRRAEQGSQLFLLVFRQFDREGVLLHWGRVVAELGFDGNAKGWKG